MASSLRGNLPRQKTFLHNLEITDVIAKENVPDAQMFKRECLGFLQ